MIIQTPPKSGDTITIKLSTGEELVATLKETEQSAVVVGRPMMLVPYEKGMGFAPWLMTAEDGGVSINKSNIVAMLKTQSDIASMYVQHSTGLAVPR